MATYVPNANQTTEPVASQPVESAALEFRTLKTHAVQFNTTDAETSKTRLPADTVRAGKYLAFDSLGRPIAADSLPATLYLGAFDVAPVTRNSGEVLATGDLYFNTVDTRMWVYDIVAGWVNYELNTQTSATAAAASAGASASSASAALTSEQNTDVSEASALAAKVAAESARDAALIQAGVYVDEPTGRAAVADGVAFKVQGSGDIAAYEYRRTNSTTSVLIATYPSAASDARANAGAAITQALFVPSANLLNKNTLTPNTSLLVAIGITTTTTGWYCSDFMPVSASTAYCTSNGSPPALAAVQFCYYDSNKAFISGSGGASSTSTSPVGAAFARIAVTWLNSGTGQFSTGSSAPASYIPFGRVLTIGDINYPLTIPPSALSTPLQSAQTDIAIAIGKMTGAVSMLQTSFLSIGVNLLNLNDPDVVIGSYVQSTTGWINALAGWNASGWIPVVAGTSYNITGNAAYYTSAKVYIAGPVAVGGISVAPAGAAYARVSIQTAGWATLQVVSGATLPLFYSPYGWEFDTTKVKVIDPVVNAKLRPWNGKNMLCLGDSITLQAGYFAKLCDVTGIKSYNIVNLGVNGQVLKTMADNLTAGNIAAIDIITLLGGTNDYGHGGATLGAITDAASANTIYGSIYYLLDKILTLKPTVRIVIFTPMWRGSYAGEPIPPAANANGLTLANISTAMVQACGTLSVPCLDLYRECGINSYNYTTYLSDNLHPNQTGSDLIGRLMGQYINSRV